MDEKANDSEAGGAAAPAQAAEKEAVASRDQSPARSTSTEVDHDNLTIPSKQSRNKSQDVEKAPTDGSVTDETASDHGEPDLEHDEAEETIPGRDLDRQLSRVRKPVSVSAVCAVQIIKLTALGGALGRRHGEHQ